MPRYLIARTFEIDEEAMPTLVDARRRSPRRSSRKSPGSTAT
jgi:hypothetical protein